MAKKSKKSDARVVSILGVGLDNDDGHRRITRSEEFLLLGGSAETHEHMQETAIRFGEKLRNKGKTLQEATPEEALDILRESMES